jgi:hypothetical protein
MHIQESDWKKLRHLKGVALERLCTQILEEIGSMVGPDGGTSHERFLKVYRHIHDRNADIAEAFADVKRSTAIHRLDAMRAQGLVADQEFDQFQSTRHA